MAELSIFGYHPGSTVVHQLDVRFKILLLILYSAVTVSAPWFFLIGFGVFLVMAIRCCGISLKSIFREVRYAFLFAAIIFVARAFSEEGNVLFNVYFLKVSQQGLYHGFLLGWRLLVIVFLSLLFITTTPSWHIKSAVQWFLRPIPRVPATRIATMLCLIVRFVPVILNQARETTAAQKARGIEQRKNPIYRLKTLAIPLLRRTFENADNLIVALEARCYSDKRTDPNLSCSLKDWLLFFPMAAPGFLPIVLP
ncbi:MAG: energy-coupling factor transporter transmembrane protein EcfT [Deltaproteobacteria bacterium]|nr:energy-coupling factor transporter transmembrane protein EcfT [Deltaproteobacteria bacterium]